MKKLALVAVASLFAFNVMAAEGTVSAPASTQMAPVTAAAPSATPVKKAKSHKRGRKHAAEDKAKADAAVGTTAEPAPAPTHSN